MLERWRDLNRTNRPLALTWLYAVAGLPVFFVIQCLVRGWDRWADALVFSVVVVGVLTAGQYLMLRGRPRR